MPTTLLHPKEAAVMLSISVATLERWRRDGWGPRFVKLGRARNSRIAYEVDEVKRFIDRHRRVSTADHGANQA